MDTRFVAIRSRRLKLAWVAFLDEKGRFFWVFDWSTGQWHPHDNRDLWNDYLMPEWGDTAFERISEEEAIELIYTHSRNLYLYEPWKDSVPIETFFTSTTVPSVDEFALRKAKKIATNPGEWILWQSRDERDTRELEQVAENIGKGYVEVLDEYAPIREISIEELRGSGYLEVCDPKGNVVKQIRCFSHGDVGLYIRVPI